MRFFIYAYEKVYNGYHGIYDFDVVDVESFDEADEIGREMGYGLIESYGNIMESLENEIDPDLEENSKEWEEALDDAIENDLEWIVYQIDESKAHGVQDWEICATYTGDLDELDEFVKRWCVPDEEN